MAIQLTGSIPGLINENTPLWDWMGQLRLAMDPSLIRFVDITGTGADFFDATLNRATGMITITPIAQADYEWFAANGRSSTLNLGLRFFMTDGSVQTSASTYSVTVLNLDDTPPQALRFSSGGSVVAGAAGAVIGRLGVTDPDTAGGFIFTIREDDQWMFEVVNGALKLRDGVALTLNDGPLRPITIEVSDGIQSAAFTLHIGVTVPAAGPGPLDILKGWETSHGFSWVGTVLRADVALADIAAFARVGDLFRFDLRDGSTIWTERAAQVQLMDGVLAFEGTSSATLAWAAYDTIFDRAPRYSELWNFSFSLGQGLSAATLYRNLLSSAEFQSFHGTLGNEQFVREMYAHIGWSPTDSGVAYHTGRLNNGVPRESFLSDLINWRIQNVDGGARAANGYYEPTPHGREIVAMHQIGARMESPYSIGWWTEAIHTGRETYIGFGNAIGGTPGYQQSYAGLSDAQFVNAFFTDMLGFTPNAGTMAAWAHHLAAHDTSRGEFMSLVAFHLSPLVVQSIAWQAPLYNVNIGRDWLTQDLVRWRQAFLQDVAAGNVTGAVNRDPREQIAIFEQAAMGSRDDASVEYWTQAVLQGRHDLIDFATAVAGTPGFQAKYGGMDSRSFVSAFQAHVLGYAPDGTAIGFWAGQIDSGAITRPEYMALVGFETGQQGSMAQQPNGAPFDVLW